MHNDAAPEASDNQVFPRQPWNCISDADHRPPPSVPLPVTSGTDELSPAKLLLSADLPDPPHTETDKTGCPRRCRMYFSIHRPQQAPALSSP